MPLLIFYDELYMLRPLISALIFALFILHVIALPAVIHLVCLSEGKELPRLQHFRSTKASNTFLNAWGKIISAETLLDAKMFV